MKPTNDERRAVASKLREHADMLLFTGDSVEHLMGAQQSDFDATMADASYRRLADLIEPTVETCELELTYSGCTRVHMRTYECDRCGKSCDNVYGEDYEFCPYCGRMVENADE